MIRLASPTLSWLAISALSANASPILYIFEGANSGLLGGVAYVNAPFTITALADTTDPARLVSVSFSVTGVSSGTLSGMVAFVNHLDCRANQEFPVVASCVGITESHGDILDVG